VPAAVALAAVVVGWRAASAAYGVIGLVAAIAIAGVLARLTAGLPEAAVNEPANAPLARVPGGAFATFAAFRR